MSIEINRFDTTRIQDSDKIKIDEGLNNFYSPYRRKYMKKNFIAIAVVGIVISLMVTGGVIYNLNFKDKNLTEGDSLGNTSLDMQEGTSYSKEEPRRDAQEAKEEEKAKESFHIEEESQNVKYPEKYAFNHGKLQITYDDGQSWIPITMDENQLFIEEKDKNKAMVQGTYYISEEKTAFIYGGKEDKQMKVLLTNDKGANWQSYNIEGANSEYGYDVKTIGFTHRNHGYVILSDDCVAAGHQENHIYETKDGGKNWSEIGNTNNVYARVLKTGAFASESIGVLCFRSEKDNDIVTYRTEDKGITWQNVQIKLPESCSQYSGEPKYIKFKGQQGILGVFIREINQMIKFKTIDYGKTWKYIT